MTDAREIIAYTIPGTNAELCFGLADAIVERLTAAGYRILGPDEVDPMTREKAAALADLAQAQREQLYSENGASINAHKAVQAEEIATAIRALGRKA